MANVNERAGSFKESTFKDSGFREVKFSDSKFHGGASAKSNIQSLVAPAIRGIQNRLSPVASRAGVDPTLGIGSRVLSASTGGAISSPLTEQANSRVYYPFVYVQASDDSYILVYAPVKTVSLLDPNNNPLKIEFDNVYD